MNDERSSREIVLRRALWSGVGVLAALGVVSAVGRAVSVASGGLSYEQVVQLMPAQLEREAFEFDRWFVAHPALTFMHVIPGGIFLALAPFQFSTRIRSRYVRFHRWSGRVLLLAALPVGVSGLMLGAVFPYGGPAAAAAVFVAGAVFLFALGRAFDAIRGGDVARHREWMIRMFSLGLAIGTIRVVGLMLFPLNRIGFQDTHVGFHEAAGTVFWIGWASTFAVAELWIRYTRPRPAAARVAPVRAAGA